MKSQSPVLYGVRNDYIYHSGSNYHTMRFDLQPDFVLTSSFSPVLASAFLDMWLFEICYSPSYVRVIKYRVTRSATVHSGSTNSGNGIRPD